MREIERVLLCLITLGQLTTVVGCQELWSIKSLEGLSGRAAELSSVAIQDLP
jgi:hypothetical protein